MFANYLSRWQGSFYAEMCTATGGDNIDPVRIQVSKRSSFCEQHAGLQRCRDKPVVSVALRPLLPADR